MSVVKLGLGSISFFAICFSWSIESFEVKVLLDKFLKKDLERNSLSLQSKYGFIVSKEPVLSAGNYSGSQQLSINHENSHFVVDGKRSKSTLYITPALSQETVRRLQASINHWVGTCQSSIHQKSELLHTFFDDFINQKNVTFAVNYDPLMDCLKEIFLLILQDLLKDKENVASLMSDMTLEQHVHSFLQAHTQRMFLDQLLLSSLTRKERQLLYKDKQYRYDFFNKNIDKLLYKLLHKFIPMLPRNIIAVLLHQEIETIQYDENNYVGTFALVQEGDYLYLINCLDIDDYLLSVIRTEGWPGWPLEVNKVIAVACRTYLVWQVLQAQKIRRPYHIENSIRHQTYKGYHKYLRLKKAIEETKDVCVAFQNKPILAMFDSCCGGIVPADIDQQDLKKHPYLARKERCRYCSDCKIASWKFELLHDDMKALLQKEIPDLGSIQKIEVMQRDNAGLVKEVRVHGQNGSTFTLSGKKIYSLFKGVKSFAFNIETLPGEEKEILKKNKKAKNKKIIQSQQVDDTSGLKQEKFFALSGKGYGHHIGLCQWGAMKLVKDHHWNYQKILQFYYPGTTLIKLKYQR